MKTLHDKGKRVRVPDEVETVALSDDVAPLMPERLEEIRRRHAAEVATAAAECRLDELAEPGGDPDKGALLREVDRLTREREDCPLCREGSEP